MNLRPPGYEPGELPDCSTPRRSDDCSTALKRRSPAGRRENLSESQKIGTRYDARMTVADWIALVFLVVALVASSAVAVVRGLRLWRALSSFSTEAETALDTVMRETAKAEERAASLTADQERLTRATDAPQDIARRARGAARRGGRGERHARRASAASSRASDARRARSTSARTPHACSSPTSRTSEWTELVRRTRITRLGEGVDARRRLLPVPVARVRNVLADYRRELEELGAERTLAVATSAVRDAENGEAFLGEVEWSYGFATRLLTGDEEAAMTLRGVGPLAPGTVVIDIGGGSTELITESFRTSLDIGSRPADRASRCRFGMPPPQSQGAPARARRRTRARRRRNDRRARGARRGHARGRSTRCSNGSAPRPMPNAARASSSRTGATSSPPGCSSSARCSCTSASTAIAPSPRDLLNGAALEAAELPDRARATAPPGAYTCC